jgi:DNA-binding MarR family transcriptional regulator
MPVRFDEYERNADAVDWRPSPGSNAATVLAFLLGHPETGFTPSEIAAETGVPRGSVGPTLQRLRERGLVRHREPYWAVAEDDRIATYESMLRGMEALADDDAWSEVDAAEHTVDESELAEWRERADGDDG